MLAEPSMTADFELHDKMKRKVNGNITTIFRAD